MRVILFNGPPRCGKDTAASLLYEPPHTVVERFSFPIKRAFAGFMGVPIDDWGNVASFEDRKEEPISGFSPRIQTSYRDWQILFSETFVKPSLGDDAFARLLVRRLEKLPTGSTVLVPDCGFQSELDYLSAVHHMDLQITLIRLYRAGTSFTNDSRSYLTHPDAIDIDNNSTLGVGVFHNTLKRALA